MSTQPHDGLIASTAPEERLHGLIASAARGDRAAFRTLYETTSAKLFGVVLRIVRDRDRAEEVLQEVYLRVWRRSATYDPAVARPVTWMASIARNAAIDFIRAEGARPTADDPDGRLVAEIPAPAAADPADLMALRRCLQELADPQRSCVLLAYYEGWSREELSERFDRPVGTIKSWLHRGVAALQSCLERS